MKILLIVISVIAVLFISAQIYITIQSSNTENYTYNVVKNIDNLEIRTYNSSLFTSVTVNSNDYKKASRKGFSILAGYIFGNNSLEEKIAMTSPVSMSLEDSMTMMFMVPKKFTKETLPTPNNSNITFVKEPSKTVATIRFKGWANNEKLKEYKYKLISILKENSIEHTNKFYYLGYNPPYQFFNRKNEIIVELNENYNTN